ncbi:hypothetical protein, partial [uncultured Rikenella sp.]|uniref:hypothetical protein n=1 Tax=uncultured Rikenella sp. TaxID=368003 RepID=UPI0025FA8F0E
DDFPLKAWRAYVLREGTVLFVNKKNQKNFRRMLRILKLPTALFFDARRGNLAKTRPCFLTISLLRRGARLL